MQIDISSFDKADVLRVLYDCARTQGLGVLHYTPGDMTREKAEKLLEINKENLYFDYLGGRVMKIDLNSGTLNTDLYDRDNGNGAAQAAIDTI